MTLLGREGLHLWTPSGASASAITLNKLDDESTGAQVWPRFRIIDVVHGLAQPGDSHDKKVGSAGSTGRPDYRGSKLHTYTIEVMGRTVSELRSAEQTLRNAFADQSAEGKMDVRPHALAGLGSGLDRYFNAKPLALDPAGDFEDTSSPHQGMKSIWTLALRNHAGKHYETLTLARFKASIVELGPALYWALDSVDLANDLSPNDRDGTAVGGVTIGGYSAGLLAGISGDSATDFDGSNDIVTSTWNMFSGARTVIAWASRDTSSGPDVLWGEEDGWAFFLLATDQDVDFAPGDNSQAIGTVFDVGNWPGNAQPVFCAVTFDEAIDEAELYLNGVSSGPVAVPHNWTDFSSSFQVGNRSDGSSFSWHFDGKVSHVAIFERVLSAEEIATIYEYGALGRKSYN